MADNANGIVRFAATRQRPAPSVSGGGGLLRIVFVATAPGGASVAITGALLADIEGIPIPVEVGPGAVVTVGNVGWIVGRVQLQGRTNHSGAVVTAGGGSTATDSAGAFRLAVPAGVYSVSAEGARYLDALKGGVQVRAGGEVVLPVVKLLGGDANDDGMVNIVDLAMIGAAFGSTAGPAGMRGLILTEMVR